MEEVARVFDDKGAAFRDGEAEICEYVAQTLHQNRRSHHALVHPEHKQKHQQYRTK